MNVLWAIPVLGILNCSSPATQGHGAERAMPTTGDSGHSLGGVSTGTWGGEHVRMRVMTDRAEIDLPCATGSIQGAIPLDGSGRFDVPGTIRRFGGAPPRSDPDSDSSPQSEPRSSGSQARFRGEVTGDRMTLSIQWPDNSPETAEKVALKFGSEGNVPICP